MATTDQRNPFEMPAEFRAMAEASVEQARKSFENFMGAAKRTAEAMEGQNSAARSGVRDIGTKALSFAERNMQASLDYAQSLMKAKDAADIMRLHAEYVQTQMRNLAEQASEMGQAVAKSALDATKQN
jgi:phasin